MDQRPTTDIPKSSSNNSGDQEIWWRQRWRTRGVLTDPRQPLETISENGSRDQNILMSLEGCSSSVKARFGRKRLSYSKKSIECTPNNKDKDDISPSETPLSSSSYLQDAGRPQTETPPFVLRKRLEMSENARNYLEKEFTELSEFTTKERQILSVEGLPEALEENSFLRSKFEELVIKASNLENEVSALQEKITAKNHDYSQLLNQHQNTKAELDSLKQISVDYQVTIESIETKWTKRETELKKSLEEAWNMLSVKDEKLRLKLPNVYDSFNASDIPKVRRSLDNEQTTVSGGHLMHFQYKIDELIKDNINLKKAVQDKLSEIERLNFNHANELANSDQLVKELESQLVELKETIKQLQENPIQRDQDQRQELCFIDKRSSDHKCNTYDLLCETISEPVITDTTFHLINLDATQTMHDMMLGGENRSPSSSNTCQNTIDTLKSSLDLKSSNVDSILVDNFRTKINDLNAEIDDCRGIISAKDKELIELKLKYTSETNNYTATLNDLQDALNLKEDYVAPHVANELRKEIDELTLKLEEISNAMSLKDGELNSINRNHIIAVEEYHSTIDGLRSTSESTSGLVDPLLAQLEESRAIISEKDKELSELNSKYDTAMTESTAALNELEVALKLKENFVVPSVVDGLRQEIEELKIKIEEMRNDISLKDEELISVNKTQSIVVKEYQNTIDDLKSSLELKSGFVAPTLVDNLKEEIADLKAKLEESRAIISDKDKELSELNSKYDTAMTESTAALNDLEVALKLKENFVVPSVVDGLRQEIEELKIKIEEMRNDILLKDEELISVNKNQSIVVKEYQNTIDDLKSSLELKSGFIAPTLVDNLKEEIADLKAKLEESRAIISDKDKELSELNSKYDTAMTESTAALNDLEVALKLKENFVVPSVVDGLRQEIEELKQKIEDMRNDISLKDEELISVNKNQSIVVKEYQNTIDDLKSSLELKSGFIAPTLVDNLKEEIADLKAKLEESRAIISDKDKELSELNSKYDTAMTESTAALNDLEVALKLKENFVVPSVVDGLRQEIEELKQKIEDMRNDISLKDEELISVNKNQSIVVKEYQNTIDDLKSSLELKLGFVDPTLVDNLKEEIADLKAKLEESRAIISDKDKELSELNSKHDTAMTESTAALNELEVALKLKENFVVPSVVDGLRQEIEELKIKIEEMRNDISLKDEELISVNKTQSIVVKEYQNTIDDLKSSLELKSGFIAPTLVDNLKEEIADLKAKLEESRAIISDKDKELSELNSKYDTAMTESTAALNDLEVALKLKENFVVPSVVDGLRQEIEELKLKIEDMRNDISLKDEELICVNKNQSIVVKEYQNTIDDLKSSLELKSGFIAPTLVDNLKEEIAYLKAKLEESRAIISVKDKELSELNSKYDTAMTESTAALNDLEVALKLKENFVVPSVVDGLRQEIEELKQKIEDMRNDISLKDEELISVNKNQSIVVKEYQNTIDDLKSSLELKSGFVDPTLADNLKEEIADLKAKLEESRAIISDKDKELSELNSKYDTAMTESTAALNELEVALKLKENFVVPSVVDGLRQEIEELKQKIEDMRNDISLKDEELISVNKNQSIVVKEYQNTIDDLKSSLELKSGFVDPTLADNLKEEIADLKAKLEESRAIISDKDKELSELNSKYDTAMTESTAALNELEVALKLKENFVVPSVVDGLRQEIEELKIKIEEMRNDISLKDEELISVNKTQSIVVKEYQNTIDDLKSSLELKSGFIAPTLIDNLKEEIADLKAKLEESRAIISVKDKELSELNSKYYTALTESSVVDGLRQEIDKLKLKVEERGNNISLKDEELKSINKCHDIAIEEYKSTIDNLRSSLDLKSDFVDPFYIDNLKKGIEDLNAKLGDCRNIISAKEEELSELNSKYDSVTNDLQSALNRNKKIFEMLHDLYLEVIKGEMDVFNHNIIDGPPGCPTTSSFCIDRNIYSLEYLELHWTDVFVKIQCHLKALKKNIVELKEENNNQMSNLNSMELSNSRLIMSIKDIQNKLLAKSQEFDDNYVRLELLHGIKHQSEYLKSELVKCNDIISVIENDNMQASIRLLDMENKVNSTNNVNRLLRTKLKNIQNTIIEYTQEISAKEKHIQGLMLKNTLLSEENEECQKLIMRQSETLNSLLCAEDRSVAADLQDSINKLRKEILHYDNIILHVENLIGSTETDYNSSLKEKDNTIQFLHEELNQMEKSSHDLEKQVNDLTSKVITANELLLTKDSEIFSLTKIKEDYMEKMNLLQTELNLRSEYVEPSVKEELEKLVNEMNNEISQLRKLEEMKNAEVLNLVSALAALENECSKKVNKLEAELEKLNHYVDPLVVQELERQISELTEKNSHYKEVEELKDIKINNLSNFIDKTSSETFLKIEELQAQLDVRSQYIAPSVVVALEKQVIDLSSEIINHKESLICKESEIMLLSSSFADMKDGYIKEIGKLQVELDQKSAYVEPSVVMGLENQVTHLSQHVIHLKESAEIKNSEIATLMSSLSEIKDEHNKILNKLQAELDLRSQYFEPSVVQALQTQIRDLMIKVSHFREVDELKDAEIKSLTSLVEKINSDTSMKIDELSHELNVKSNYVEPSVVVALEKQIVDLNAEILTHKESLTSKDAEIIALTEMKQDCCMKLDELQAELDLRIEFVEPSVIEELEKQINELTNEISHLKEVEAIKDAEIKALSQTIGPLQKPEMLNENTKFDINTIPKEDMSMTEMVDGESFLNCRTDCKFKIPEVPIMSYSYNRETKLESNVQIKNNSTQGVVFGNTSGLIELINVNTVPNITVDEASSNETLLNNSQLFMDVNGSCIDIDPFMSVCYKDSSFIDTTCERHDSTETSKGKSVLNNVVKVNSVDSFGAVIEENNYLKSTIISIGSALNAPITEEELNNVSKDLPSVILMKVKSVILEIEKTKKLVLNLVSTDSDSDLIHLVSTLCARVMEQEETISNVVNRTNELKSKLLLLSQISADLQMLKNLKEEIKLNIKQSNAYLLADLPIVKDRVNEKLKSLYLCNEKLNLEINDLKCKLKSAEENNSRHITECNNLKIELEHFKEKNGVLLKEYEQLKNDFHSDLVKLHHHETSIKEVSAIMELKPSESFWEGVRNYFKNVKETEICQQNLEKEYASKIEYLELCVNEKNELVDMLISEKNKLLSDVKSGGDKTKDILNKNCVLLELLGMIKNIIERGISYECIDSQKIESCLNESEHGELLAKIIDLVQQFVDAKLLLKTNNHDVDENLSETISSLLLKLKKQDQLLLDYNEVSLKLKSLNNTLNLSSDLRFKNDQIVLEMKDFRNDILDMFIVLQREIEHYKGFIESEKKAVSDSAHCNQSVLENLKRQLDEATNECNIMKNVSRDYDKLLEDYNTMKTDYNIMLDNWTKVEDKFNNISFSCDISTNSSVYEKLNQLLEEYHSFRKEFQTLSLPLVKEYTHEINSLRVILGLEMKTNFGSDDWKEVKSSILKTKNLYNESSQYSQNGNGIRILEDKILALESELLDVAAFKRTFAKELHDLDPQLKVFELMELPLKELHKKMFDVIMEKERILISNIEKDYENKIASNLDKINQLQDQDKKRQVWVKEIECENERLNADCKNLQLDNNNLKAEIMNKIDDLNACSEKLKVLESKLDLVPIDIWNEVGLMKDYFEEKLPKVRTEDHDLIVSKEIKFNEKIKNYEETLCKLNLELNEKILTHESLIKKLNGKDYTIESMKMQIEELSSEKVKLINKIDSISYSLNSLQKEHEIMKKKIEKLQNERAEIEVRLKKESDEFINAKQELENQLQAKQTFIQELQSNCQKIKVDNGILDTYIAEKREMESVIIEKDKIIEDLESKVHKWAELNSYNDTLIKEKSALESKLIATEKMIEEFKSQSQSAEEVKIQSLKLCELLQSKIEQNESIIGDLKSEIKKNIEMHTSEKQKFEQSLQVKELDIVKLETIICSMKDENNSLKAEMGKYDFMAKDLLECQAQKQEFEVRIRNQEEQFSTERRKLEEAMDAKMAKVRELEFQIKAAKSKYNETMKIKNETCHILEKNLQNSQNQVRKLQEELNKQNMVFSGEKFKLEEELKINLSHIKELQESLERLKLKNIESFGIHFLQERLFELFSVTPESVDDALQQIKEKFDRFQVINEQLTEEKDKCSQLDDECEMMYDRIKYLEEQLNEAYVKLEEAEKKCVNLRKEMDLANITIKQLENSLATKEKEIRQFEEVIINVESECAELNRRLVESQETEVELRGKLEDAQQFERLDKDCDHCWELKKNIEGYMADMVDRNAKIADLELKIVTCNHSYQKKAELVEEYSKKISQLKEELRKLKEMPALGECANCKAGQKGTSLSPGSYQGEHMPAQPSNTTQNRKIAAMEEKISKLEKDRVILKRLCQNRAETINELRSKLGANWPS